MLPVTVPECRAEWIRMSARRTTMALGQNAARDCIDEVVVQPLSTPTVRPIFGPGMRWGSMLAEGLSRVAQLTET